MHNYLSNYYILNIYDYSKSINEFILYKEKFFEENKKAVIKFYISNNKLNLLNFSINFLNIYIIISKINLKYIIMKKYIYRKNNKKLLSLLNWLNRFSKCHFFFNKKKNINILIFFIKWQFQYKILDSCYNIGLYWEQLYNNLVKYKLLFLKLNLILDQII